MKTSLTSGFGSPNCPAHQTTCYSVLLTLELETAFRQGITQDLTSIMEIVLLASDLIDQTKVRAFEEIDADRR